MKKHVFVYFILFLTIGALQFQLSAEKYFGKEANYEKQIIDLKEQLKAKDLEVEVARYELRNYQQEVALVLPQQQEKIKNTYQYRGLASLTHKGQDPSLGIEMRAKIKFKTAKEEFRKENYTKAIELFQFYITQFSFTKETIEAYFLLAESQFQKRDWVPCVKTIEKMVDMFPSSEMSGFALIRLGKIYELKGKPNQAIETYRLVMRSFPYRGLASQAEDSLRDIGL